MKIEEPGLFGETEVHYTEESPNPMVKAWGPGPEGKLCRTCVHMRAVKMANVYWKCDLRKLTHGPGTDHRRRWPACGKYEAVTP